MASVKPLLDQFSAGSLPYDNLLTQLQQFLRDNPQASSDLIHELTSAHDRQVLTQTQYHELLEKVVAADTLAVTESKVDDFNQTMAFSATAEFKTITRIGPGSVIKRRFELGEALGQGGMGTVYRARDLIKVEAKDRNPWLAVKVLNEDFKSHPESFIALQRECSKTQKLAHPNIATVYDFDRTAGMVYMTMELLEGQPLNEFIKNEVGDKGLSFVKAWPIIEQLGEALAFAHQRGIVHADFKPGNCFLCKDGTVKVLDFGIARAAKKPEEGEQKTVFDPRSLGALTPAYASCEMLEDEPPDPRDDIYALAVVSYLLLSGRHPFDKFPATLARDQGMVAEQLKNITRMQNRALQRGLSFVREQRTPSVYDFLQDMQGEMSEVQKLKRLTRIVMVLGAGFLVVAAVALLFAFGVFGVK
jgi:hypothetical protein